MFIMIYNTAITQDLFPSSPEARVKKTQKSKEICTYLEELSLYCKLGDKTFVTHTDKALQPKPQPSRQTTDSFIPPPDVPAAQVCGIPTSISAQQQQTHALESHPLTP